MTRRCGFVALIGAPNAGKSTLLNQMVGQKVAIVSHKVQTTRSRVTGIALHGDTQLIFVDTPGIFAPNKRLERAMVQAAWSGAQDADEIVLLVDAQRGVDAPADAVIAGLTDHGVKAVLALNKIDGIRRDTLLGLADTLYDPALFKQVFMISARSGDGVGDLKAWLADQMPDGPWHYPEDQVSDITQRLLAAEVTREKIYLRLHQELPYAIMVETEAFQERKDGSVRIEQVIHVARTSQKGIVIGKGGQTLKTLGEAARADLEDMLQRKVHLFLHVRVTENWADDREKYGLMGLDWVR
ncbi:MAG: GTPase Era [Rhodothalassiaceae bacterium]